MIDGARMVSPGLLHFARAGAGLYDKAVVVAPGWYLGADYQNCAIPAGYNQATRTLSSSPSSGLRTATACSRSRPSINRRSWAGSGLWVRRASYSCGARCGRSLAAGTSVSTWLVAASSISTPITAPSSCLDRVRLPARGRHLPSITRRRRHQLPAQPLHREFRDMAWPV